MATVIRQPGLRSQTSGTSGSVQYLGGYDGPYAGEEDVFLQEKKARPNEVPIPMGLEVFQGVSKLVAHQVVGEDEGIVEYADCAIVCPVNFSKSTKLVIRILIYSLLTY